MGSEPRDAMHELARKLALSKHSVAWEAAEAILAQEEQIERLTEALQPFAEFWLANRGELSQHYSYESEVSAKLPWGVFIDAAARLEGSKRDG